MSLRAGLLACGDDALALLDGDSHGLLKEEMDAGFEDLDGGLDVVEVREGKVDCVDGAGGEHGVELIVGVVDPGCRTWRRASRLFLRGW